MKVLKQSVVLIVGVWLVVLLAACDGISPASNPTIVVNPNPVVKGQTVTITGHGFPGGENNDVVIGVQGGKTVGEQGLTIDDKGNFQITYPIPSDTQPNTYPVDVGLPGDNGKFKSELQHPVMLKITAQ